MKRNNDNTDFMDTMELPVIRPETLQNEPYYDGSYDYHNDPTRRARSRPRPKRRQPRDSQANEAPTRQTRYVRRSKTAPERRTRRAASNTANIVTPANTFDAQAILVTVMAIMLVAVFGVIFYLVMTGFKSGNSEEPTRQGPDDFTVPAYVETTEAPETNVVIQTTKATEATTEATTSEATETTTETTQTTPETTTQATTQSSAQATEWIETTIIEATEPATESTTEPATELTDPPIPTETSIWDDQEFWTDSETEPTVEAIEATAIPIDDVENLW